MSEQQGDRTLTGQEVHELLNEGLRNLPAYQRQRVLEIIMEHFFDEAGPTVVRTALQALPANVALAVIIDGLDRIPDESIPPSLVKELIQRFDAVVAPPEPVLTSEANKDIAHSVGEAAGASINRLATAAPGDVHGIAASQIALLTSYYSTALVQARASFRWALIAAGTGLVFFIVAAVFLLTSRNEPVATVGVIGGAIVEVLAGINFYLYNRTTAQLSDFFPRLEQTQRFLMANNIIEHLESETKQTARASLVNTIATT